ncbi:hypothetical protein AB0O39_01750 [Streptomyces anulatus]|uniref:hypothetical protein n=1 Tax=Streptomyces anulatus TaxID=1892 RepID=UPI003417C9BB
MRQGQGQGAAYAGFRAALALLVAVVALLCVVGHVQQRDSSPPQLSAAELTHLSDSVEPPSGAAAPCAQKAVADQSAQRAENAPQTFDLCAWATSGTAAVAHYDSGCGAYAGGPAPPPPPPSLHSVLRI